MSKRNTRFSGALLLVLISMIGASLACYSDQLPDSVFKLTPYYTPTPIDTAQDARFDVLQVVLAPLEQGRAFFNLTVDPEPLDANLVNSKAMCDSPAPAQVLYAGVGMGSEIFYLVDCVGSVGWVQENRLAGPLLFSGGDLAIAVGKNGAQTVEVLDATTFKAAFNPLQQCKPETIVRIADVQAEDPDGDGLKDIYYKIECPTTGGPLTGLVTNADLFGPVQIAADARAISLGDEDGGFQLANEPMPVTADNAVEGECEPGAVLEASEAKLVEDQVFYNVTCGDIAGWVSQENFVGPLLYNPDDYMVVYVPSMPIFEDQLALMLEANAAESGEGDDGDLVEETSEADQVTPEGEEAVDDGVLEAHERKVVQYTPPLYLTDKPEAPILGAESNVVGQCFNDTIAHISEYAGRDTVYYRLSCERCIEEETDEDGLTTCVSSETQEGWADQQYLQGPVEFIPGDLVTFKSSSAAVEADEATGVEYSRVPASLSGASSVGRYTQYAGRCPVDEPMEVVGVVLDKARTSDKFNFFYRVICTGETATYERVDENGKVQDVVTYHPEDIQPIEGFVSARDIVPVE